MKFYFVSWPSSCPFSLCGWIEGWTWPQHHWAVLSLPALSRKIGESVLFSSPSEQNLQWPTGTRQTNAGSCYISAIQHQSHNRDTQTQFTLMAECATKKKTSTCTTNKCTVLKHSSHRSMGMCWKSITDYLKASPQMEWEERQFICSRWRPTSSWRTRFF